MLVTTWYGRWRSAGREILYLWTFDLNTAIYIFVLYQDGVGCWSRLGMEGGAQPITLQKHCRDTNVIVHEIGNDIIIYYKY